MIRTQDFPGGLEATAKDMARQVLEGLARLHKHNLVHLDIKPGNIFVKGGVYKVGDLGHTTLARISSKEETGGGGTACSAGSSNSGGTGDGDGGVGGRQAARSVAGMEEDMAREQLSPVPVLSPPFLANQRR